MKFDIGVPEYSPIKVTFESQQEVIWLTGLLTCSAVCEIIREVDEGADAFFDDLYNALKSEDNSIKSSAFADELGLRL